MENVSANPSYYDWSYDFRHVQSEAVNYVTKLPDKEKNGNLTHRKLLRSKENPKTCPVCGVLINNPWNLTVHIRRHNNEKPFKCDKCTASFVIQYELKVHLRSHSSQLIHKCNLCQKMFKTVCGKRLHEDTHGMNEYCCRFCAEKFTKFTERRKHESSHKSGELKCLYCFKKFGNLDYKKQHEATFHNKPKAKEKSKSKFTKSRTVPTCINRNNNHRCKICSERFTRKKDYFIHVQKLHPDQTDIIFKICKICGKKFTGYYYVYHMKAHLGDMPYSCTLCEYKTAREKDLRTHMRAHSSAKPFNCIECGKSFKLLKSLKLHEDTHTGKKDIKCSLCDKTFFTSRTLEEHKLKVHFKKYVKCKLCDKEVCSKYIKTHVKNEHEKSDDPVICEHCGKCYPNESKLKQHLITINFGKTKSQRTPRIRLCPYCDEEVSCRLFLVNHCKQKHPTKVYKCIVCAFTNLNVVKYKKHIQRHFEDSSFELKFSEIFAKERKNEDFIEECNICGSTSSSKMCIEQHKVNFDEPTAGLSIRKKQKKIKTKDIICTFANVFCKGDPPYKMVVKFRISDLKMLTAWNSSKKLVTKMYNLEITELVTDNYFNKFYYLFLSDFTSISAQQKKNELITTNSEIYECSNSLNEKELLLASRDVKDNNCNTSQRNVNKCKDIFSDKCISSTLDERTVTNKNLVSDINIKTVKDVFLKTSLPNLKLNTNSDIANLKGKLHTFNGKKFLSVDDLCNLKENDLKNIINFFK